MHNEVLNLSRCLDRTEISASELLSLHDNQKNITQSKNYSQLEKSLALITDENGLLHSRGRLKNALLPYGSREPTLLDNRHYLTELIVQDACSRPSYLFKPSYLGSFAAFASRHLGLSQGNLV